MQVGQRAFEPVADLDAHLAVVLGDQQQDAVVLAGLAEAPGAEQPVGIGLDRLAVEAVDGGDDDLVGAIFLEVCELLRQRGFGRRVDHAGIVDHAAGQRREFGGEGGEREEREDKQQRRAQPSPARRLYAVPRSDECVEHRRLAP